MIILFDSTKLYYAKGGKRKHITLKMKHFTD